MKYKHYILTRFNLGIYDREDAEAWMEHRISLFDSFFLPSWQRQKGKTTLILAFDQRTPDKLIKKYNYIDNIQIVYEQPHFWLRKQKQQTQWIITSRFDNDDMMHDNYIYEIQKEFSEKLEVIDVDYYGVDLKTGFEYSSERYRPNSPFLSLVEPWDNIKTAMTRPHTNMPDDFPARKIEKVLAYQLIHDRNICNHIIGTKI